MPAGQDLVMTTSGCKVYWAKPVDIHTPDVCPCLEKDLGTLSAAVQSRQMQWCVAPVSHGLRCPPGRNEQSCHICMAMPARHVKRRESEATSLHHNGEWPENPRNTATQARQPDAWVSTASIS